MLRKRIMRGLRLAFFWLLLIGLSSELLVRFYVHNVYQSPLPSGVVETDTFQDSPLMPDGLRPVDVLHMVPNFSAIAESTGILYETNAWAFRDDPVDMDKQHVIFLGDSTTFGLNIPHETTYAEIWEKLAGEDWQAINTAIPGQGTIQEYDILQDVLVNKGIEPEWVVVGFCANDPRNVTEYGSPSSLTGLAAHSYVLRIAEEVIAHARAQSEVRRFGTGDLVPEQADVLWGYRHWQISLDYLGRIHDLAAEHGAQTVILYIPLQEEEIWHDSAVSAVLTRYTNQEGIPFVDGVKVYQRYINAHDLDAIPDGFYSIPGDMGHPGILASELLGQAVYEMIQSTTS